MLESKKTKKTTTRRNNKARVKRGALGNRTNVTSDKRDVTQARNTWKAAPALATLQRYGAFPGFLRKKIWGKNKKVCPVDWKKHALEWIKLKIRVWLNALPPSVLVPNSSSAMLMGLKAKGPNWFQWENKWDLFSWRRSGNILPCKKVRTVQRISCKVNLQTINIMPCIWEKCVRVYITCYICTMYGSSAEGSRIKLASGKGCYLVLK